MGPSYYIECYIRSLTSTYFQNDSLYDDTDLFIMNCHDCFDRTVVSNRLVIIDLHSFSDIV
jgi:hypothetical protein